MSMMSPEMRESTKLWLLYIVCAPATAASRGFWDVAMIALSITMVVSAIVAWTGAGELKAIGLLVSLTVAYITIHRERCRGTLTHPSDGKAFLTMLVFTFAAVFMVAYAFS